ncbi:MAG: hypothetical protein QM489_02605 [Candidatus Izemoplasma sp.]
MKKIILGSLLLVMSISFNSLKATEYSRDLPGGKNYIDILNVIADNSGLYLIDTIKVIGDTDYTFSFPAENVIGDPIIVNISGYNTYLEGDVSSNSNCSEDSLGYVCTFHTIADEDEIYIEILAPSILQFYDYYGVENIQLEVGLFRTEYEEYYPLIIDTVEPVISGAGIFINSYDNPLTIGYIIASHITVVDEVDGDLSNMINIVSDLYSGNESIVGEYLVSLEVSDNSGNTAYFDLTILIKDQIDPYITGPSSLSFEVGYAQNLNTIISNNYVPGDDYDLVSTIEIVSDNYSLNMTTTGSYNVLLRVTDSSLNTFEKSILISIIDSVAPTLNSTQVFTSNLSSPLELNNVINNLVYTDNYDDSLNITIAIVNDLFSVNSLIIGTYFVDISLTDLSGNIRYETLTFNVIDDIAPVISGPINIVISYSNPLTIEEIIAMLSVNDNYDSLTLNELVVISDLYSLTNTELGIYNIVFSIDDYSGNNSLHTITMTVIDDVPPIIYIDSYIVTVNLGSSFQEEDAVKLLLSSGELVNDNYRVSVLINEYVGHEDIVGNYIYKINLTNESGEELTKEFLIQVIDIEEETSILNELSYRNISIYAFSIIFIGYIIIKRR